MRNMISFTILLIAAQFSLSLCGPIFKDGYTLNTPENSKINCILYLYTKVYVLYVNSSFRLIIPQLLFWNQTTTNKMQKSLAANSRATWFWIRINLKRFSVMHKTASGTDWLPRNIAGKTKESLTRWTVIFQPNKKRTSWKDWPFLRVYPVCHFHRVQMKSITLKL